MTFSTANIPNQQGKTIIVTGANAGLGFETAKALASKGATVIMACRSQQRAEEAMTKIRETSPNADLVFLELDLTDLDSVRRFAREFSESYTALDVLINNAGVMGPAYTTTKDGFELQMGANYFGHFLLTGLLFDQLTATPDSRVVSLSSIAHLRGEINFPDLHWEKSYSKFKAYQQSKLACLMFALEFQRRLEAAGASTISVAAHPGVSPTELSRHIPKLLYFAFLPTVMLISHSPQKGALPTLMAATDATVKGGDYYGPQGFNEMRGKPGKAKIARRAKNPEIATRLWAVSEELTGFIYPV
jgi:NAD(P)-dependent dehydrogenase (short-subunit alcohol dehydrogenase family)